MATPATAMPAMAPLERPLEDLFEDVEAGTAVLVEGEVEEDEVSEEEVEVERGLEATERDSGGPSGGKGSPGLSM